MGHIWIAQDKALSHIYLLASYSVYRQQGGCVRRVHIDTQQVSILRIVLLDAHFAWVSLVYINMLIVIV